MTVITALIVVMVLSVAMSVHHYEKTVLITLDAAGEQAAENETGLAEIRRQLEADKADASTRTMFWNGSVCVTKYRAWGGRTTTYYVCPYLSAVSTETIGDTPKVDSFAFICHVYNTGRENLLILIKNLLCEISN